MTEQDLEWILKSEEGQFFEMKSFFDRSTTPYRPREIKAVKRDIAETSTAMANADGGSLVIGIEDDKSITGVPYSEEKIIEIKNTTKYMTEPPIEVRITQIRNHDSNEFVLVFQIDPTPHTHRLTNGKYLRRIGSANEPVSANDIDILKAGKRKQWYEAQYSSEVSLDMLNLDLLTELKHRVGLNNSEEDLLLHYRLANFISGRIILTKACILLFSNDPLTYHPSCYLDFVKWEGISRLTGKDLNVIYRERIEGPLPIQIKRSFEVIKPHIKERQKLQDLFFTEKYEYPEFAWQEAIINAIAHRDYSLNTPIEIHLFDDRIEFRSPGSIVEPVNLDSIRQGIRIHASRNPRIVRVLTDFGFMRELGEGIPRMYHEMEKAGLNPPNFNVENECIFSVVLHNTVIFTNETMDWLSGFDTYDLNQNQKRILAFAYSHGGSFTSKDYQELMSSDIYSTTRELNRLKKLGLIELIKKGGRVYRIMEKPSEFPIEWKELKKLLKKQGYITNQDVRHCLKVTRAEALRVLRILEEKGIITLSGKGRGSKYMMNMRAKI